MVELAAPVNLLEMLRGTLVSDQNQEEVLADVRLARRFNPLESRLRGSMNPSPLGTGVPATEPRSIWWSNTTADALSRSRSRRTIAPKRVTSEASPNSVTRWAQALRRASF